MSLDTFALLVLEERARPNARWLGNLDIRDDGLGRFTTHPGLPEAASRSAVSPQGGLGEGDEGGEGGESADGLRAWDSSARPWALATSAGVVLALLYSILFFIAFRWDEDDVRLSAVNPEGPHGMTVFLTTFEDAARPADGLSPGTRRALGYGATETLGVALRALAPRLAPCRRFKIESDDFFRFEAKIDHARPGFTVVSLLAGADRNQPMTACLRDRINQAQLAPLSRLKRSEEGSYVLKFDVQVNLGLSLPQGE